MDKLASNYKNRTNYGSSLGIGSSIVGIIAIFSGPIGWAFGISLALGAVGLGVKGVGYFSNYSDEKLMEYLKDSKIN